MGGQFTGIIALLVVSFIAASTSKVTNNCKVDAVLVIDNSWSVTNSDAGWSWSQITDFAADLAKSLDISPDGSHVGLVDFHTSAKIHFGLLTHVIEAAAVKSIKSLRNRRLQSNAPAGIRLGRSVLTRSQYGPRPGVPKIMFLLTDGVVTKKWMPHLAREIEQTQNAGIRIVAIGLNLAAQAELRKFINSDEDAYLARSANVIKNIKKSVLNSEACQAGHPTKTLYVPSPNTIVSVPSHLIEESALSPCDKESVTSPTTNESSQSPCAKESLPSPTTEKLAQSPCAKESLPSPTTNKLAQSPCAKESLPFSNIKESLPSPFNT